MAEETNQSEEIEQQKDEPVQTEEEVHSFEFISPEEEEQLNEAKKKQQQDELAQTANRAHEPAQAANPRSAAAPAQTEEKQQEEQPEQKEQGEFVADEQKQELLQQLVDLAYKDKFLSVEAENDTPKRKSPFSLFDMKTLEDQTKHKTSPYVSLQTKNGTTLYNRPNTVGVSYRREMVKDEKGELVEKPVMNFEDCMTAVRLGMAKGWTKATLTGPEEYKKQMYLAMRAAGMEVVGYKPSPELEAQGDKLAAKYADDRKRADDMEQRFPALDKAREKAGIHTPDNVDKEFMDWAKEADGKTPVNNQTQQQQQEAEPQQQQLESVANEAEPAQQEQTVEPQEQEQTVEPQQQEQTVEPQQQEQTVEPQEQEQTVEPQQQEQTVEPQQQEQESATKEPEAKDNEQEAEPKQGFLDKMKNLFSKGDKEAEDKETETKEPEAKGKEQETEPKQGFLGKMKNLFSKGDKETETKEPEAKEVASKEAEGTSKQFTDKNGLVHETRMDKDGRVTYESVSRPQSTWEKLKTRMGLEQQYKRETFYEADGSKRQKIANENGTGNETVWNPDGKKVYYAVTGKDGKIQASEKHTYDENGACIERVTTNEKGSVKTVYTENGYVSQHFDKEDKLTKTENVWREADGTLHQHYTDGAGNTTHELHEKTDGSYTSEDYENGHLTKTTEKDADNHYTKTQYDENGNKTQTMEYTKTGLLVENYTVKHFDKDGNTSKIEEVRRDENGFEQGRTITDGKGNKISEVQKNQDGTRSVTNYENGQVKETLVVDANGKVLSKEEPKKEAEANTQQAESSKGKSLQQQIADGPDKTAAREASHQEEKPIPVPANIQKKLDSLVAQLDPKSDTAKKVAEAEHISDKLRIVSKDLPRQEKKTVKNMANDMAKIEAKNAALNEALKKKMNAR